MKYVNDPATLFQKYEIEVAKDVKRRGVPLDTKQVKAHFIAKNKKTISVPVLGRNPQEVKKFENITMEWGYDSLIWVCVKGSGQQPAFYSHVGKINRFHHSSLTSGGDVIGAGEWIVEQGKLLKISANSGHYRPPIDYFYRAVLYLAHAWLSDTTVLLWNTKTSSWEDVPILTFKANANGGGTYKTHPSA